jgi:malonyl-ACP decarboxylase
MPEAVGGGPLVTGIGVLCSIGADVAAFTAALREGRSGVGPGPADGSGAPIAGFNLTRLLAERGYPAGLRTAARRAAGRSPLPVQAALAVALEAWTGARVPDIPVPGDRVALIVAGNNLTGAHAYAVQERHRADLAYLPGRLALQMQDTDYVGVISQVLAITGEGHTVGGASASGNVALLTAARLIAAGAADACLVVGAPADLSPPERQAYRQLGAMAAAGSRPGEPGPCRPFDAAHRGFVDGQGAAALLLESASSARGRAVAPLARLAGGDLRLSANALADPSEAVEALVMTIALARAGVTPAQLGYVSTHGTASPLGDQTEARALTAVLAGRSRDVWLNATKALTGHCLCAAGVIEAVATIVQMTGGFVHPNPYLSDPIAPGLRFAGAGAEPARLTAALSNSFGFGGFHSAVVFRAADA